MFTLFEWIRTAKQIINFIYERPRTWCIVLILILGKYKFNNQSVGTTLNTALYSHVMCGFLYFFFLYSFSIEMYYVYFSALRLMKAQ